MKNYIKKIMAWIVIASITIGIASGCSKSEREKENKEDKKVITLMSSTNHVRDVDRKLAEKFEKETGIHVDFQLTVGDQYADAVMACLQSGEGPDIFMGQVGTELESFQPDIYALDLSNEAWVKKYPDWVKEQMTYDGKMVGFTTWGRDLRAMVYNKNLFEKYDIDVPVDYASFKAACEKLMENGVTPVYFPGKKEGYCVLAFDGAVNIETKEPGTYEKLNRNETTYAESKEAVKYLENLRDSAQSGYFGENYFLNEYGQSANALASEEYAMWFGWVAIVNDVESAGGPSADSFGAFPSPFADDFSTVAVTGAGVTRMVNKDSANIEECKKYFDFLAKEENLQIFYDGRQDLLESTMGDVKVTPPACFTEIMEQTSNKTELMLNTVIKYHASDEELGRNIQDMLVGKKTPEQVLETLDHARQNMFEKEAE